MGMFDEILCLYPLPDALPELQGATFQTKSLESALETYTISAKGRLFVHRMVAPVEEGRPIAHEAVDTEHHGDIVMYTSHDYEQEDSVWRMWYQYRVRFTEGQVQWIRREQDEAWMMPRQVR
jgi:hypothetical protein